MDILERAVQKNEKRNTEPPKGRMKKDEIDTEERQWGARVKKVTPAKLTTVWMMLEDPLMNVAGEGYKATQVRTKTFELQQEAGVSGAMKGNRKLTKVKVAEAMGAMKPTIEQTKVIAGVLYVLREYQTVIFNEEEKTVWTMPEDLRNWNKTKETIWVDERCEKSLEWEKERLGEWLSEREREGWNIQWPVAEGGNDEIRGKLQSEYPEIQVHSGEVGKKPKKEDYAKALGRAEAIERLMK